MVKVMIVDDNKDIAHTLEAIMRREGYETDIAYDGAEFLDKVDNANPDLVLLDIMMPGLTTRDILMRLKEKKLNSIRIILVTAVRLTEEERDSLVSEPVIKDYVTKPFNVYDITERVKRALQ
jgi:two-component system response regulator VicR